jgi:hypothetical protein
VNYYDVTLRAVVVARDKEEAEDIVTDTFPDDQYTGESVSITGVTVEYNSPVQPDDFVSERYDAHFGAVGEAARLALVEAAKAHPNWADELWVDSMVADGQYMHVKVGVSNIGEHDCTIDLGKGRPA